MTNPGVLLVGPLAPAYRDRDLDIAIVGQLPPSNLPLCDEFEAGPVKVVGFEASFRRRGLRKQDLECVAKRARRPHTRPHRCRTRRWSARDSIGHQAEIGKTWPSWVVLLMFQDENRTGPSWCRVLRP